MATYYIDGTRGSNSNTGLTEDDPLLTLSASVPVVADTVVKLKCGTRVQLTGNVAPANNYTLESYGQGSEPVVVIPVDANSNPRIEHNGSGTFTVRNIQFENSGISGLGQAVSSIGTAKCVYVENIVHSPFLNALRTGSGAEHYVAYNKISKVINNGIIVGTSGVTTPSRGVYEFNEIDATDAENDAFTLHDGTSGGTGNIIRFNTIIGGIEQCIDVVSTFLNTFIYRNECVRSANAVESWGAIDLNNTGKIIGNIIRGAGACIKVRNVAAGGVWVVGNICICGITTSNAQAIYVLSSPNTLVYNNTLVANTLSSRALVTFSSSNGSELKNNLLINGSSTQNLIFLQTTTPGAIENNIYVLDNPAASRWNSATFASWQSTYSADADGQALSQISLTDYYGPIDENSVLFEAGLFVGYIRDCLGKPYWNPPCVGAIELSRDRIAR